MTDETSILLVNSMDDVLFDIADVAGVFKGVKNHIRLVGAEISPQKRLSSAEDVPLGLFPDILRERKFDLIILEIASLVPPWLEEKIEERSQCGSFTGLAILEHIRNNEPDLKLPPVILFIVRAIETIPDDLLFQAKVSAIMLRPTPKWNFVLTIIDVLRKERKCHPWEVFGFWFWLKAVVSDKSNNSIGLLIRFLKKKLI